MKKLLILFISLFVVFVFLTLYFVIGYNNLKNKKPKQCEKEIKYVDISGDEETELICEKSTINENTCNEDVDYVYPLIVKSREDGFIKKYFPEDYKVINKEDIKCNNIKVLNNVVSGVYYDVNITDNYGFQCFLDQNKCYEYSIYGDSTFSLNDLTQSFIYAKNIVQSDFDQLSKMYKTVGLYPLKYNNGDTLNLEVREYKGETDYSGKLITTYVVNFKTKTFIKK